MRITKILTIVFFLSSLGVAGYLFQRIRNEVVTRAQMDGLEARIIAKLDKIRRVQKLHYTTQGSYLGEWSALIDFVTHGKVYLTVRREEIITLDYGADSVLVSIDTMGVMSVRDSLFLPHVSAADIAHLQYVPQVAEVKDSVVFMLFVGKMERNGLDLDVLEVKDPTPANPNRRYASPVRSKQPLHFGSRTNVSLAGNWE